MPELPEVETIRKQLDDILSGRSIVNIEVLREKSFSGDPKELIGYEIQSIGRKSKVIEINFRNRGELLIVHLKMTGQIVYLDGERRVAGGHPTADWVRDLPSKHTRVILDFDNGSKLFFNDMRVFGWMKIVKREEYEKEKRRLIPDVVDDRFDFNYLKSILSKSRKAIKLVIMDQEKIGGVGNIYANDALFLARVLPDHKANELTDSEILRLLKAVKEVINKGIKYGGASAADDKYVNVSGLGGKYQDHFLVYQKDSEPCSVCGNKIIKSKIGGRGTFYCQVCQK